MNLLKYWKKYTGLILVIICLLIVQAYCDLALPSYTADIVDVGLTNSGIEYAAPVKISKSMLDVLEMFLTDEQQDIIHNYYDLKENDIYELNSKGKKHMKQIDEILSLPMVMVLQMSAATEDEMGSQVEQLFYGYNAGMVTKEEIMTILDNVKTKMSEYGDSLVKSQAIAFVKAEYERIGVDTDKIQKDYLKK